MRMNKLLVTLAFSMLFSSGVSVAAFIPEEVEKISTGPTDCYQASKVIMDSLELGILSQALAIKLCTGARDGLMVTRCFVKAVASVEENGLDLPEDIAISLCKQNG